MRTTEERKNYVPYPDDRTDSADSPDCLPIPLSLSVVYFFVLLFHSIFSCWSRVVD